MLGLNISWMLPQMHKGNDAYKYPEAHSRGLTQPILHSIFIFIVCKQSSDLSINQTIDCSAKSKQKCIDAAPLHELYSNNYLCIIEKPAQSLPFAPAL